jgi:hypothetical protein
MRKIPEEEMVCADRTAGEADCCERSSYFIFPVCGTQLKLNPQFNPRVLERRERTRPDDWTHGLIIYIDTKAKCRHKKIDMCLSEFID